MPSPVSRDQLLREDNRDLRRSYMGCIDSWMKIKMDPGSRPDDGPLPADPA